MASYTFRILNHSQTTSKEIFASQYLQFNYYTKRTHESLLLNIAPFT